MPKWGSDDDEIPRRDQEMSDDRAEVKKVESIGKKACWGGIGISVLGGVLSAIGIGKDTEATKFQNWFGASMGLWVLILIAQAICLWEVSDRLGRHNDKLVKRCKWFYLAVTIFAIGLLLLLLSIWVRNGSFVDATSSQTSNWVLLVLDSLLLFLGTTASLFVYFRYATNIKYTDSHTAKPLQPLRRTLSEAASKKGRSIKRTLSDRTHRSKLSTRSKTTQEIAYSPPSSSSGDDLPQFPEYDRKKSMESGETVSRPVSPLPDQQGSQSRRSVDTYFDERGPPYPDSDLPPTGRSDSRGSTRTASRASITNTSLPSCARNRMPLRKPVPQSIPYVPRPSSPDYSSGSDSDSRPDQRFLPVKSTTSRQSKKPDELFLDAPTQPPSTAPNPPSWLTDRNSLPSQRPSSSYSSSSQQYQAYSPPRASSPPATSPLLTKSTSPPPSQYRAYSPPSSTLNRNSTVSTVQTRYSTSASTIQGGGGSHSRTSSISSTSSRPDLSTYGNAPGRKPNSSPYDSDTDSSIENYLQRTNSLGNLRVANP
ncbi:hypothetical protein JCM5353_002160 [Sporobolomyces roseus]